MHSTKYSSDDLKIVIPCQWFSCRANLLFLRVGPLGTSKKSGKKRIPFCRRVYTHLPIWYLGSDSFFSDDDLIIEDEQLSLDNIVNESLPTAEDFGLSPNSFFLLGTGTPAMTSWPIPPLWRPWKIPTSTLALSTWFAARPRSSKGSPSGPGAKSQGNSLSED